jgi:cysteine synthase A
MGRICGSVIECIGRTPLVRLARVADANGAEVCAKLESKNPGGSVKDRAALSMIEDAEGKGLLEPGATIVEATSGNTGVSLAMIAAVRGYACVLVMPDDMSMMRRHLFRAYGAELVLTPAAEGMRSAVERATEIAKERGGFMPRQFENPANPAAHERTTALEILDDTAGRIDVFLAGVGTGGTLTGIARVLRENVAEIRIVAVEPRSSAVLSGGKPGMHGIQGLGAGFVPPNLDRSLLDEIVTVSDVAADRMARRLAREEGLLVGPSAGANVHAAVELARRLPKSARLVTVLCDTGERYFAG